MRLIDADALKREILDWTVCLNHPQHLDREDVTYVIDSAPTIDAEPVRHGKWIYKEYKVSKGEGIGYFVCSECGQAVWVEKDNLYCSNCGAKMDKED